MNRDEIRDVVLAALSAIAPELDPSQLDPREDMREALDLDSMDVLRFATALHQRLGVDVPESDYGRITTVESCIDYLVQHGSKPSGAPA